MSRLCLLCTAAGTIALLAACGSEPAALQPTNAVVREPNGPDELAVPGDGFQIRSVGADIAPGEDVEYCEIGELPGDADDVYYVHAVELANAAFSHHFVVATAEPDSDADQALRAFAVGDKIKCNGANFEWPEEGLMGLASSQTPYLPLEFPSGVGTVLHGGERVVFDYHYVNTSDHVVRAESAANIHVADGATIDHIATAFSFFNFTLDVPPGKTGTFTAECHFNDDLMVAGLVRHTHERGRDFSVWYGGGPEDGQPIWTSHDWKHDIGYDFGAPIRVDAGEGFRFQCDFENTSAAQLRYGIRGSDEMCILAGWVWGADGKTTIPSQNCGVVWVDEEGIGRAATDGAGFPPATEQDAGLCLAGFDAVAASGMSGPGCKECLCNSCGSVILSCAADPDCAALLGCFATAGCSSESECIQSCKQEIHDHSSAVGMMQQVNGCLGSRCSACGPTGG